MFYFHMFLLTLCVVFIVDASGFVWSVKPKITAAFHLPPETRLRPFDCSLCMTFWAGIVLCAFQGFTIPHLAFVCLCAYLARFVENCYLLIREALSAVVRLLMDKIEKL